MYLSNFIESKPTNKFFKCEKNFSYFNKANNEDNLDLKEKIFKCIDYCKSSDIKSSTK